MSVLKISTTLERKHGFPVASALPEPSHLPLLDFAGLQTTRLEITWRRPSQQVLRRQNHPEAEEVFVRVVASSDKTVEVKPGDEVTVRVQTLSQWAPCLVNQAPLSGKAPFCLSII